MLKFSFSSGQFSPPSAKGAEAVKHLEEALRLNENAMLPARELLNKVQAGGARAEVRQMMHGRAGGREPPDS